jgi:hypothetical protein
LNVLSFCLAEYLSGFVPDTLAASLKVIMPRERFEPHWENPTVAYSDYADETKSGPRFSFFRPQIGQQAQLMTRHLREEVLAHAK